MHRAIGILRRSGLPLAGDVDVFMPPVGPTVSSHNVPGTRLRVLYMFDERHVILVSVHRSRD